MHKHTYTRNAWRVMSERTDRLALLLALLCAMHGGQLTGAIVMRAHDPQPRVITIDASHDSAPAASARHQSNDVSSQSSRRTEPGRPSYLRAASSMRVGHASSIPSSASSVSSSSSAPSFPPFGKAVFPVSAVPNWGNMYTPEEWNRTYGEMTEDDFVALPSYDLLRLTVSMDSLLKNRRANIDLITAKLAYSTRYFGAYDLDAGEFSGNHPGIDLKLAEGTPLSAVAGGRVRSVREREHLGLIVIIEHRTDGGEVFYSVYAHLGSAGVREGQDVAAGEFIGTVGMTGNTSAPHLHLQIDRGAPGEDHVPYAPRSMPSREEAARKSVHPVGFIRRY